MSEKLYEFLLKLYPDHFRRTYGDEMLRLVHDRARSEKGFLSGLRLWLDLLLDLAISLFHEYSNAPTIPIVAIQPLNGEPSFHLLAERSLNPGLLFLAGTLSAVLLWACVTAVAHSRIFPGRFRDSFSLQALVQTDLTLARSPSEEESPGRNSASNLAAHDSSGHSVSVGAYSFCMTAQRDIPGNSVQPLFAFNFARPGASGAALVDGKVVKVFQNEQHLSIRGPVFAGDHQFVLHLDKPAENTFISNNDDFAYCQPK